jgi:hypothetical protein
MKNVVILLLAVTLGVPIGAFMAAEWYRDRLRENDLIVTERPIVPREGHIDYHTLDANEWNPFANDWGPELYWGPEPWYEGPGYAPVDKI